MPLGSTNAVFLYRTDSGTRTVRLKRDSGLTQQANPLAGSLLAPTTAQLIATPTFAPKEEPRTATYSGLNSEGREVRRTVAILDRAKSPGGKPAVSITAYDYSTDSTIIMPLKYRRGEGVRFFDIYKVEDTGLKDGDTPT